MEAREAALKMLIRINEEGLLCHKALNDPIRDSLSEADRSFFAKLVRGTLERMVTCDMILSHKTGKPVSKQKPFIRNLLRMGCYQLLFLSAVPASAVCNEAVKAAKKAGFTGLSGFVNGVLRSLAREITEAGSPQAYLTAFEAGLSANQLTSFRYSVPDKWVRYYETNYKAEAEDMFRAFLTEPGTAIRLNKSRGTAEELLSLLQKDSIDAEPGMLPNSFRIRGGNIAGTEAYKRGLFSVQDESSCLCGNILPLKAGMKVLDVCAAPGGKTLHVLDELSVLGGGTVQSGDISKEKLTLLQKEAERLGFPVSVKQHDATVFESSYEEAFDIVLCDLPCSGLGVIGRKPDIKDKTDPADIKALAAIQQSILEAAVRYVKPGGYLCYSTCTITKEENDEIADSILKKEFTASHFSERVPERLRHRYHDGRLQLFPQDGTDGFFTALFQKNGESDGQN